MELLDSKKLELIRIASEKGLGKDFEFRTEIKNKNGINYYIIYYKSKEDYYLRFGDSFEDAPNVTAVPGKDKFVDELKFPRGTAYDFPFIKKRFSEWTDNLKREVLIEIQKNIEQAVMEKPYPKRRITGEDFNSLVDKMNETSEKMEELHKIVSFKPADGQTKNKIPLELSHLHPVVQKTAGGLFRDGHYRQAILDTYIALVDAVKQKSGEHDLDNTNLMQKVFSQRNPIISISSNQDEQVGFMWLFSGAVMGIRNPKAHRLIEQNDSQRTLEWLSFASVLLRVLDDATVNRDKQFPAPQDL